MNNLIRSFDNNSAKSLSSNRGGLGHLRERPPPQFLGFINRKPFCSRRLCSCCAALKRLVCIDSLNKVSFVLADCIASPPEYFLDILGFVPQGDVFNGVLDDFVVRMTMPFE